MLILGVSGEQQKVESVPRGSSKDLARVPPLGRLPHDKRHGNFLACLALFWLLFAHFGLGLRLKCGFPLTFMSLEK